MEDPSILASATEVASNAASQISRKKLNEEKVAGEWVLLMALSSMTIPHSFQLVRDMAIMKENERVCLEDREQLTLEVKVFGDVTLVALY